MRDSHETVTLVGAYGRTPLPPGIRPYQRDGTWGILMAFEPLRGPRFVQVREQRTKRDYPIFMRELAAIHSPEVEIERSVLSKQCLGRRIGEVETLERAAKD